jgi:hypothetical protein
MYVLIAGVGVNFANYSPTFPIDLNGLSAYDELIDQIISH